MLRQGEAADGEVEVAVWRLLWHAAARYLLQRALSFPTGIPEGF